MNLAGPINARQLEVLQWIADGCPHGVMKDCTYKTTAIALQGRRLVTLTRKGGGWQAELTDAGGHYLRHRTDPDGFWTTSRKTPVAGDLAAAPPVTVADRRRSAAAESAGRSWQPAIDVQAQHLVARVIAAGGILEVDTEDDEIDYERLLTASKSAPNLPFGKQLRLRTVGPYAADRCEIYIEEDFSVAVAPWPVPVPRRVAAWHPAVAAYRADADRQEVSMDSLARASHILQAVASGAARRGYTVVSAGRRQPQYDSDFRRSLKDGQIRIGVDGFTYQIRLRERVNQPKRDVEPAALSAGQCVANDSAYTLTINLTAPDPEIWAGKAVPRCPVPPTGRCPAGRRSGMLSSARPGSCS